MSRSLFTRLTVTASLILGVLLPLPAYAGTDPFAEVECTGQPSNSAICQTRGETGDPITGPNGALVLVTNVIALVAGFAAVIFLVMGGIKYITSGGAPDAVSRAKETIIYALIGIIVILISRALIGFVINRL